MIAAGIWLETQHLSAQELLKPKLCPSTCNLMRHVHEYVNADTVWFHFENGVVNVGEGELYAYSGDQIYGDTVIEAWQRIEIDSGGFFDTLVGQFIWHDEGGHNHFHFDEFVQYRLLELDDSSQVMSLTKSGFCLTDGGGLDTCLSCGDPIGDPPIPGVYTTNSCHLPWDSLFMGISVGYVDVYSFPLDGQAMNVAEVPNGAYWLESTANAGGKLVEMNATPDVALVKVSIISTVDTYEDNDTKDKVDAMTAGIDNSAKLAACQFPKTIDSLSIHQEYSAYDFLPDHDWFRFRLTETADSTHFIKIIFDSDLGDLDLQLLDSSGEDTIYVSNADMGDSEFVDLDTLPAGVYYAHIYADTSLYDNPVVQYHTNWNYSLTIDAPANDLCGDVNDNDVVNAADILHFNAKCSSNSFTCETLADVDSICGIDCTDDLNYLIAYVFQGGSDPYCTCE